MMMRQQRDGAADRMARMAAIAANRRRAIDDREPMTARSLFMSERAERR